MPAPAPAAGRAVSPVAGQAVSYALVLLLTALLAAWGTFLVPLRLAEVPVPLGVALAAATLPLGLAGGRVLDRRVGAVVPGLLWLGAAMALASPRREGDVLLTGLRGYAFLAVGLLGAGLAIGLWRPASVRLVGATPRTAPLP